MHLMRNIKLVISEAYIRIFDCQATINRSKIAYAQDAHM